MSITAIGKKFFAPVMIGAFWAGIVAPPPLNAADLPIAQPAPAEKQIAPGWTFTFAPYLWASGLSGDVATFPPAPPASIDLSFGDILEDLNFAGMIVGAARKGRFGVSADLQYYDISTSADTAGIFFSSAKLVSKTLVFSALGDYVLYENGNNILFISAGARLWAADTELKLSAGPPPFGLAGRNVNSHETWVDPMVGLRGTAELSERFFVTGWGYVGGFGAGSDIMADVMGSVGYRFTDSISSTLGYRWQKVDYENNGFVFDVEWQGPIAGLVFRF
ncbi:hypothetical protein GR183_18600 [Stappia sp. GBMRC 2046]|uniref:Uncharacterized protein n=1 Tax=Stappia sediminis TaxID=2692190 RepID=A0A7X3S9I4_9HYPH|nr:hypothetical protein [Stappia sediminis]MXN66928.1 hypothetical protein [Stappia sediminis]